jgi:lipoprotein-anchoring transpeptidase ErfK/SrfK
MAKLAGSSWRFLSGCLPPHFSRAFPVAVVAILAFSAPGSAGAKAATNTSQADRFGNANNGAIARNPGTFSDTQNHWARQFIDGLASHNLIIAASGSTFRPNEPLTRAQFAVILQRTFPYQAKYRNAIQFSDVPSNHWAAAAIAKAYEGGFLSGQGQAFLPNEYVTRSQVLVAIANGLDLTINPKRNNRQFLTSVYTDGTEVPNYAVDQIAALSDRKLVVNYPDASALNPNRPISRGELAALIYQALAYQGQLPKIAVNYAKVNASASQNLSINQVTLLEVNLSKRRVTAFQGDKKLKSYAIAVGRAGWETPAGVYKVRQTIEKPAWKNPFTGDVIKSGAPDNPLGLYWIGFWTNGKDWSGFHGTPNRNSVGQAVSHGCIRMYNEDIKELFSKVSNATVVRVIR